MAEFAKQLLPVNIEDEMRQSYMDYAMSVIIGRALPDVRDGLKPVHRRVLFTMGELNNDWNKAYKKSARVVGDVMGKYHPHGDTAIYDTMVRMAQPFSLRYLLVDGQGNFGSIDGDAPAAMRYTEVRMAKIAHELLADLDKETVDFSPNYDESEHEPVVLPARFPNLLVNGASGIAVGMATNIPPHNLNEVIDACVACIDDPNIALDGLMGFVKGPDFPTGGIISGARGIRQAYRTGRGRIYVRAVCEIEDEGERIVVRELPYQVNKARLIERIAELVKEKKIEGIASGGLRDESDKDGMRVVIELKRGENAEVLLNNLYQHTQLQTVFGINNVALVGGQPRTLNLKELLQAFIDHRREVVTRRTIYELRKARERAHILEGQAVALANIDPIIELIKASQTPAEAKVAIMARLWQPGVVTDLLARADAHRSRPAGLAPEFGLVDGQYRLSAEQAQAILDLRLNRLTGLEQDKIVTDYRALLEQIDDLLDILARPERLMAVIRDELLAIKEEFGDERRTVILEDHYDLSVEDLIEPQDVVVTLSHTGYVKAQPVDVYQSQRRGGRGKRAATMKDEDFVERVLVAHSHDTILCFSSRGKVYWMRVFDLPLSARTARGRPIVNLLPLQDDEKITAILPVQEYRDDHFVLMATSLGTVKKTTLTEYSRPRSNGIIAVDLQENDQLVGVALTDGTSEPLLCSSSGKVIRFREEEVRPMGRAARGVRGIRLTGDQRVIALIIPEPDTTILTATENGYGKRTRIDDYPVQGRGGQGVIGIQTTERNGPVVGACAVHENDEIMLISSNGTLIRTPASDISLMGRNTQGVSLIRVDADERLVGLERIADEQNMEEEG